MAKSSLLPPAEARTLPSNVKATLRVNSPSPKLVKISRSESVSSLIDMSVGVGKETTEVGATVVNVAGTDVCVEVGSKEEEVGKTSTEKVQPFSTSMINSQVLNNINHLHCFIIFSLSAIS
jgi:hypothetical protein